MDGITSLARTEVTAGAPQPATYRRGIPRRPGGFDRAAQPACLARTASCAAGPARHALCRAGTGGSRRPATVCIDRKYFDRIFVIFQRLHARDDYPGNGIGLAICKKIVERHGGLIWVECEIGNGATFCFTLRAAGSSGGDGATVSVARSR